MSQTILYICATCGMPKDPETGKKPTNPQSEALAARANELLADMQDVDVRLTKCLSLCNKPIAWALDNPERHATTFAPATTAEDMVATVKLYLTTPLGEKMPKKDLPPEVKPTLISRIPPFKA
ncbi:MAG: DUF1636 domain-containing protein [Blastochloris viridis]|uniref:DUF1636 domain-containing protein n=1 Tax=Blastochloris viridis TaxID=1079 RepID=A0A6N4QYA1_BLAVI|nr:MAG: DUF1636 domain-containing protein [Blastochloris viridis]